MLLMPQRSKHFFLACVEDSPYTAGDVQLLVALSPVEMLIDDLEGRIREFPDQIGWE